MNMHKKWEKVRHKPGSVLQTSCPIWREVIYLGHLLPNASSGLFAGLGKDQPSPLTLLPTGVYRAMTSRSCWCALTAPLHPYL